ncbi:transcriptional regulator [Aeromonas sobria]|uniref:Transcriptional regulator n=1 Tax=Aeromonas sobria TaxID=646 RepID=A0A1S2D0F9_AERSO|nr:transcriptional regulator [Aeromonas sobria]MBS4688012.1 transcriptional regulator [Aeromonas sobria]OHY94440.1 transcriptional regulator [Aeromonas sobria]
MQTETHDQTLTPNSPELLRQTDHMLARIHPLLAEQCIIPNEVQRQMLASHVKAMVWRSYSGEPLPEVDLSLFDEISPLSLRLAEQVVSWLERLAYEEAHLLSVHFEVAKENELSSVLHP